MRKPIKRSGFTLIELLVVVMIVIVLAGITFAVTGNIKQRAAAVKRMSDIRQSGIILLSKASEMNNRCQYFYSGSGNFELRPYYIVKTGTGLGIFDRLETEIMSWDSRKLPPKLPAWNCRAINFQNVPKLDARWINSRVEDAQGRTATAKTLSIGGVSRPGVYPLLIDSSKSNGEETFRINEGNGDYVGLREAGMKANAFMLDGSVSTMGVAELKAAGFTKAYDNATTPPRLIGL